MTKHNPLQRKITDWTGKQRITWCGPFSVATVAGTEYEPGDYISVPIAGDGEGGYVSIKVENTTDDEGETILTSPILPTAFIELV